MSVVSLALYTCGITVVGNYCINKPANFLFGTITLQYRYISMEAIT